MAPPPNPPRISFSVGCLQTAADISVITSKLLIIADYRCSCKCGIYPNNGINSAVFSLFTGYCLLVTVYCLLFTGY
ncbi:MAG: hypothetical protein EWV53_02220 [Microcystis panniformis Mp_MB_F_20051200_S9]|uniref:Uncharacterized protein n=1 Tax=Microcystis panniformis Mp_MB_F_20051200_S9 TaxID=2486223 RepID=A0A552QA60_9CHRO|nr:MAG: hypothetical protein EWV43_15770 [Microcystis panniformis Mp_MB_F_20080800_S26D]TRV46600.1 MAG: hypothetical protein EWV42_18160 [Microcystis panniformis Mp_GB_SS_20050300_S99D]TRV53627.1 MAG: hypothetical protein EWV87_02800 [Microcystis panniformis Mp_GB_SS_20050300_S99]TRV62729.1 MAG: hypothetical protein EWV69_05445 [Microcystis panniformis Mp_MB_F_20080800_S26]TRV66105.1 MAG: hypothetical protein EWV53_02220 [Microcystis panniformis Mp_MB_F_20051200_S9]TRV72135.1 MAG: hypothetical